MRIKNNIKTYQSVRCKAGFPQSAAPIELIGEEPLLIRIDGKPYSVVMRTPGQEIVQVAGFCLTEGIIDSADDFIAIGYCVDDDPNVIDVRLTEHRKNSILQILQRRGFVSQTSCGICGKEIVDDLLQRLTPMEDDFELKIDEIINCVDMLSQHQRYYPKTRGSHAALIFDDRLSAIAFAEDVGRHNAFDKTIGSALMEKTLSKARMAVLSSRTSYEMVQKAARARIPVLISTSRPTALAAQLGLSLNMTIGFPESASDLTVISGPQRIKTQ